MATMRFDADSILPPAWLVTTPHGMARMEPGLETGPTPEPEPEPEPAPAPSTGAMSRRRDRWEQTKNVAPLIDILLLTFSESLSSTAPETVAAVAETERQKAIGALKALLRDSEAARDHFRSLCSADQNLGPTMEILLLDGGPETRTAPRVLCNVNSEVAPVQAWAKQQITPLENVARAAQHQRLSQLAR
jgi:hypothetical protein